MLVYIFLNKVKRKRCKKNKKKNKKNKNGFLIFDTSRTISYSIVGCFGLSKEGLVYIGTVK